jgi:hypothetical protein
MLRHVVGDETFFNILGAYRDAFQYDSAITEDPTTSNPDKAGLLPNTEPPKRVLPPYSVKRVGGLKVGINVVNMDSLKERTFAPALHGFLDTIREGQPTTPLLVASQIYCPSAERHPGPTVPNAHGVFVTLPGHAEVRNGSLTLVQMRDIIRRRRRRPARHGRCEPALSRRPRTVRGGRCRGPSRSPASQL